MNNVQRKIIAAKSDINLQDAIDEDVATLAHAGRYMLSVRVSINNRLNALLAEQQLRALAKESK